jgi:hypothetical protein
VLRAGRRAASSLADCGRASLGERRRRGGAAHYRAAPLPLRGEIPTSHPARRAGTTDWGGQARSQAASGACLPDMAAARRRARRDLAARVQRTPQGQHMYGTALFSAGGGAWSAVQIAAVTRGRLLPSPSGGSQPGAGGEL